VALEARAVAEIEREARAIGEQRSHHVARVRPAFDAVVRADFEIVRAAKQDVDGLVPNDDMRDRVATAGAGAKFEKGLGDENLQQLFALRIGAPFVARVAAGLFEGLLFSARLLPTEAGAGASCALAIALLTATATSSAAASAARVVTDNIRVDSVERCGKRVVVVLRANVEPLG
jgi:hypothetical protein